MKAKFLKIAKVKSEKDFYKKYPTEEAFFKAHPEARMMQVGGAPTANQFFDYGMSAKGPLIAPETWYQEGGSNKNNQKIINKYSFMFSPDERDNSDKTGYGYDNLRIKMQKEEGLGMEDSARLAQYIAEGLVNRNSPNRDFVKAEKDWNLPDYSTSPQELDLYIGDKDRANIRKYRPNAKLEAQQPFGYGMEDGSFQFGGSPINYDGQTQLGGEAGDQYTEEEDQIPDYQNQISYNNEFVNMLYPDTQVDSEETGESDEEEATEDESSEYAYGGSSNGPLGYFQSGGSKSAFNYGQWPAMKTGGEQGGNIDAVNSSTKENFLSYIRKNVADDMYSKEMGQGMDQDMSQGAPMAQYGYGMGQSGYNPNMYNQDMFQGNIDNQSLNRQEGFNNLRNVFNADLNNRWSQKTNQLQQEDRDKYINQLNDQINNQMAKNVGKPSGDVVSKPADAGQQTIDLAPNTNNIYGTQPSFQPGGESFKRDSTYNYDNHYNSPLNRFHNTAAIGNSEGDIAGWYAAEEALKKKNPMQLSNASVAKLGLQGVIPRGTTDIDRKRILSINPKAVNQGEGNTWTPGSYGVTQDAIMNRGFFEYRKGGAKNYLPKAQLGAQANLDYTSPNLSIENYDINKIIENSKKAAQNLSQKRKDEEEIKTIQDFKEKRDAALKELSENPEGTTISSGAPTPGGLGSSIHTTPLELAKNLKYWDDLYKTVYNSYFISRNIASPAGSYTSQEDYYKHLSDPASPAKTAAQQAWIKSPGYKPVAKAPVATDATVVEDVPVVKTPAIKTSKGSSATLDTIYDPNADYKKNYKKEGGSLPKAQTGTIVSIKKDPNNYSQTTYSDGTIVIKDETGKVMSTTPGTASTSAADQTKIVPNSSGSASYDPNYDPSSTNKPTAPVVATTKVATNPATQTVADVSETDARKKAIHDLALAYGVDPSRLQQLVDSQGTGYYGQSAYPYRYHHRGYGNLLADRGDIPDKNQIMAMQAQANQMGYNMKYRHNPLTGRVVIKTKYNPNTGKMEHHPSSNDGSSLSLEQRINQPGWIEDKKPGHINTYNEDLNNLQAQSEINDIDASQDTKQYGGRLGRFLPKHQAGTQTGMGNPQSASANGTPNTMGKKGNEKAVYNPGNINPYTSDYIEASMNIGTNFLNSPENRNNKARLAKYQTSDYTHPATQKDMGDYVANGQQWGSFRPNQTTPAFDTGYERGNAGDAFSQFEHGGSMSPYSYPSQLPAIPGRNQSDNMSMYTHWNQRPVMAYGGYMQQGGSMYQEDGVYNLSDDEINNIIQQGGQVEYLD